MKKVSIIGSGNVGATAALITAKEALADVVLLDIVEGVPQGKALDLSQAMSLFESPAHIIGTNDYDDITGSDVVVITAGLPRQPGMSRSDLLKKNSAIVTNVIENVVDRCPEAILLIVTNPLDVMSYLAFKKSGLPKNRVMGMGGLLDTSRLRYFISDVCEVDIERVYAMVIGAHSNDMVPLISLARIDDKPLNEILGIDAMEEIKEKTINGGAKIVSYLKTGSAFYAPGSSAARMVRAILRDEKTTIPTCCLAEGEYGIDGIYINLPAVIGSGGVEKIVETNISDAERGKLLGSVEAIKSSIRELGL